MAIVIRLATAADEDAFLDLLPQLFKAPGPPAPWYTRERGSAGFRWALERENADVLLAFDGDTLVGLSSVYADIYSIRYGPRCWLQDLVVRNDRRGQGIGAALIRESAEWARAHGCTHLELASGASRLDAHRFYRSRGMSESKDFMLWLDD